MKKERKLLALLLLVFCMVFALAACGNKDMSDADVMKQATENMNALKSMTAETSMEMVFSMGEDSMTMTSEMTQKVINDPISMEIVMNMVMGFGGETQEMESTVYAEADGDNLITYTQMEGDWYKMTQPGLEALEEYDTTKAMGTYLEAIQNFKKTGTEDVAGVKADKYEGVITEDYFQTVLEESGLDEQFGFDGEDSATLKELFEGIGEMPITIWIDGEKLLPVKYYFDMTNMMSALMKNMGADEEGLAIDKVILSMVLTGFDNVDAIDIPQEAREAEELELEE